MSALTIIQKACSRLAITVPGAVFSSTDDQVIQLRHLMNQEGDELTRMHPWTALQTETTFVTVAAALQTSAIPSDFAWYINDTMWNRTTDQKILGPFTAAQWQQEQAVATGAIYPTFRFRGGEILITPTPTAGQTVAYEYVSANWAETSGGSGLSAMTADTDVPLLDDRLIILGITWRFLQSKGLDYAEAFRTYQLECGKAISRDGGRKSFYIGGASFTPYYYANIPDGSWNQ